MLGEQRHQVVEVAARVIGAAVARESKAQRGAMRKRKLLLKTERVEGSRFRVKSKLKETHAQGSRLLCLPATVQDGLATILLSLFGFFSL